MKKLFLAALLVVGLSASAQEKPAEGKSCSKGEKSCKSPEQCVQKMTKTLDLTADQQTKVKSVVTTKRSKIKAAKTEADAELKTILTAEQYAKWSEMKKEKCSKGKKKCCKSKKSCSKDKKKE